MPWQVRGPGRSACRWSATATSVEPHWSPTAGSSLQLIAFRTLMPSSENNSKNSLYSQPVNSEILVSADTQTRMRGELTWGCEWWQGETTEQPPGWSGESSSTHNMTSSHQITTSLSSSSVLRCSSVTWCSLCVFLHPRTLLPRERAATSQAGGFSWRTVRDAQTHWKTTHRNDSFRGFF